MASLAAQLLGHTRSAVLGTLLLRPETSLHVRELARTAGASAGSLHRELRMLADLGLLVRQKVGSQVHYRANQASPVFPELAGLLRKTAGLADVLRGALEPLRGKVQMAFVFGSVATGTDGVSSDVDVMVLGAAGFAEVVRALASTQEALRREVNPTVMSVREFSTRVAGGDGFARGLVKGPRLWLTGSEEDMASFIDSRKGQRAGKAVRRLQKAAHRA